MFHMQGITVEELSSNASVLIIAGSETTATLLSAATYFLGTHPHVLKKLNDELSTHFKSEAEIDLLSVQGLTYMLAVLDESARLYPPVPSASPRMIGPGGDTILGRHIPEGVSLAHTCPPAISERSSRQTKGLYNGS